MKIGQAVKARFETIPALTEGMHPTKDQLYPIRRGAVVYIHPRGWYINVKTETAGGAITETFRPGEVQAVPSE